MEGLCITYLLLKQGRRGACSLRSFICGGELLDALRYVYMMYVSRNLFVVRSDDDDDESLPLMLLCAYVVLIRQLPVTWQNSRTLGVSRTISPCMWNSLLCVLIWDFLNLSCCLLLVRAGGGPV